MNDINDRAQFLVEKFKAAAGRKGYKGDLSEALAEMFTRDVRAGKVSPAELEHMREVVSQAYYLLVQEELGE